MFLLSVAICMYMYLMWVWVALLHVNAYDLKLGYHEVLFHCLYVPRYLNVAGPLYSLCFPDIEAIFMFFFFLQPQTIMQLSNPLL